MTSTQPLSLSLRFIIGASTHPDGSALNIPLSLIKEAKDSLANNNEAAIEKCSDSIIELFTENKQEEKNLLLLGLQKSREGIALKRRYFESGCACIASGSLEKFPPKVADSLAVSFYEKNCHCSRNYINDFAN
jgi:hypothetical protein